MHYGLSLLRSVRPSNLVLLAAAPFIAYLFISSTKYSRSLIAILGIEPNAAALLGGFAVFLALGSAACVPYARDRFGLFARHSWIVPAAIAVQVVLLALVLLWPGSVRPFVASLVANSVDPFTSDWIVPTVRPRQLTDEAAAMVMAWLRSATIVYAVLAAAGIAGLFAADPWRHRARQLSGAIGLPLVLYLAFFAHWGFATGVAVTFRAAIFAYILSAIIGLCWTGLALLKPHRNTIKIYAAVSVAFIAAAVFFFAQPRDTFVLVGDTSARIAIISGTPQSLSDAIRFGEYPGAESDNTRIRSTLDATEALELMRTDDNVSGAFVPVEADTGGLPVLWEISFLPSSSQLPALILVALGGLLGIFTLGAWLHGHHPLAVGAEFFVNTLRGIPMLVIILYVGLPLSGAVKEVTQGGIDLPNMARGVFAIALGYSAYMAEIFRAGIEAVHRGQIEAASSLGMHRWQIARLIVLPQALRVVIPPLGNEFIAMIKDTSLLSILSVRDITQRMREFQAASFLPFAPFNTAAIIYVVITLACASFLKWIERRYDAPRH